jgi:hypothetical protein
VARSAPVPRLFSVLVALASLTRLALESGMLRQALTHLALESGKC